MTTTTTYTTIGSVRGSCGHHHRTLRGAARCIDRDHAGCKAQGGYSDRRVVRSDGEDISEAEDECLCLIAAEM